MKRDPAKGVFLKGDLLRCIGWCTSNDQLRSNVIYEALTDTQDGIFPDRPFITVKGETRNYDCHAKRFVLHQAVEDRTDG